MVTLNKCKAALHLLLWPVAVMASNEATLSSHVRVNRPFVVVVCSYKNEKYVERNLNSIFEQTYRNFRVIYIDDKSPDRTYDMVKKKIQKKNHPCHFSLFRNTKNLGCMENTYNAVKKCKNWEIVVLLDGDDWFAHKNVLKHLNQYYQNDNVWLTYGQFQEYPSKKIGFNRACTKKELDGRMRKAPWVTTHLRTFYAGLFKQIQKSHLQRDGKFVDVTSDQAFMLPMLDMARQHAYFIPEVMYIYNKANPITDRKQAYKQLEMKAYLRKLPVYRPLVKHPARL